MTLSDIPEKELARIKAAEKRNRSRAKKYGRKVEPVSVESLLMLQRGLCHKSGKPLIFDEHHPDYANGKAVIAHEERLAWNQSRGHVVGNVWLWRHDENAKEAYEREAPDFAKQRKMLVSHGPRQEGKTAKRGKIPQPKVSPLSKHHPNYRKAKWI